MNHLETQRLNYKPEKITILFITESPPKDGTFFYSESSSLYSALSEVFQKVFPEINPTNFLERFKEKGCYLEDLCLMPVDAFNELARIQARMEGIPLLAEKIKQYKPDVIVTIKKDLSDYVDKALKMSEVEPMFQVLTLFPFTYQKNFNKFIADVEFVLRKSQKLNIL